MGRGERRLPRSRRGGCPHSSDLPFGLQEPEEGWHESSVGLAQGDALLSVSDGVLDIYDGTLAGLEALAAELTNSPDIASFFEGVRARAEGSPPTDDITVLVVRRIPG